jgi:hypothetical protein
MAPLAAPLVHAQSVPVANGSEVESAGPGFETELRVGGFAATACGLFVRVTIATGGAFVGTIAGAVASCTLMFLDAAFN